MRALLAYEHRPLPITGKTIRFRRVELTDADFILSLRLNHPHQFLTKVDNDPEKQRQWIASYKLREQKRQEYYFIIEALNGETLGAIRIYDFRADSFCWGSWIIKPGAPSTCAIESVLLMYEYGFHVLRFKHARFEVLRNNERVIAFNLALGAKITHSTETGHAFSFSCEDYERIRRKFSKFIPLLSAEER